MAIALRQSRRVICQVKCDGYFPRQCSDKNEICLSQEYVLSSDLTTLRYAGIRFSRLPLLFFAKSPRRQIYHKCANQTYKTIKIFPKLQLRYQLKCWYHDITFFTNVKLILVLSYFICILDAIFNWLHIQSQSSHYNQSFVTFIDQCWCMVWVTRKVMIDVIIMSGSYRFD